MKRLIAIHPLDHIHRFNLILRYMKLIIKRGKETIATGSIDYPDMKTAQQAAKRVIAQPKYKGCYACIDRQS
jgi:hypothetical protein